MSMDRRTLSAAVKLAVFTAASLVVTGTLVAIMGKFGGGDTHEYSAVFTSATMLQKGDEVRVAGVVMGKVRDVQIHGDDHAKVRFTVGADLELTESSEVEIRYLNLVGDRYLTVLPGDRPEAPPLDPGSTIPATRTTPALDLTALYNGFAPLFSALEPSQVNELSLNLVRVLQGEGGTVESLLRHTASLTSAIADRDELVGRVIGNLDELLGTVDSRHQELTELVQQLRRWVGGLAKDRVQIGESVGHLSDFTKSLARLLSEGRPLLKSDVAQLRRLTSVLSQEDTQQALETILNNLPEMLEDQTRTGTYGSWYNYYVCDAQVEIKLPRELGISDALVRQLRSFSFRSTAERCA